MIFLPTKFDPLYLPFILQIDVPQNELFDVLKLILGELSTINF